jgi:hypothetical protein
MLKKCCFPQRNANSGTIFLAGMFESWHFLSRYFLQWLGFYNGWAIVNTLYGSVFCLCQCGNIVIRAVAICFYLSCNRPSQGKPGNQIRRPHLLDLYAMKVITVELVSRCSGSGKKNVQPSLSAAKGAKG